MRSLILFISGMILSFSALAQDVLDGDPMKTILDLVMNGKTMSPLAIGAAVVLILIQLSKSPLLGGLFDKMGATGKRIYITILGQAYAILAMIAGGTSWSNAIITGLLVSGGAVAIWEAFKPLFAKK